MTDLTTTDDWLIEEIAAARADIRGTVERRKLYVHDHWQPRRCPPHPVVCEAGGTHVWMHDADDRGSWCGCDHCGVSCDGPFYPEEEVR